LRSATIIVHLLYRSAFFLSKLPFFPSSLPPSLDFPLSVLGNGWFRVKCGWWDRKGRAISEVSGPRREIGSPRCSCPLHVTKPPAVAPLWEISEKLHIFSRIHRRYKNIVRKLPTEIKFPCHIALLMKLESSIMDSNSRIMATLN
jgi:hypothetical protein